VKATDSAGNIGQANSDRLTFKPNSNLTFGAHTVEIRAEDTAGNQASRSWSFTVVR
jgi:hypothetical protein